MICIILKCRTYVFQSNPSPLSLQFVMEIFLPCTMFAVATQWQCNIYCYFFNHKRWYYICSHSTMQFIMCVCFFQKWFIIKTWLFLAAFFFCWTYYYFFWKEIKTWNILIFKMTNTIGYRCGSQLMESLYWHSYGFWRHSLRYCGIHWACIHLDPNVVVISKK